MAKYQKVNGTDPEKNPKESADVFSILSFSWMSSTFSTGNKRPLDNSDLFPLLEEDKTQGLTERLEETWNDECRRCPDFSEKTGYRLLRALIFMFHWSEYGFLLSTSLIGSLCNVLQPLFLSMLLLVLMNPSTEDVLLAYVYGAVICISSLIRVVIMHQFGYNANMMAIRWKAATIGLIFKEVTLCTSTDFLQILVSMLCNVPNKEFFMTTRLALASIAKNFNMGTSTGLKVLRLNRNSPSTPTSGFIMDLVAGDAQRFDLSVIYLVFVIQAVTEVCAISVVTWCLLGYQALAGLLFMACLIFYYGIMGKFCTKLRSRIAKVTDRRLNTMHAIVPGIRAVKMHAWEWPFMEMVAKLRRQEIWLIRLKSVILSTFSALIYSSQSIASCISIAVLSASGSGLTSYNMLMTLSLITTLRGTISANIAVTMSYLADFFAGLGRIQTLLEVNNFRKVTFTSDDKYSDDRRKRSPLHQKSTCSYRNDQSGSGLCYPKPAPLANKLHNTIFLDNVTCGFGEEILKSVSMSISEGELVMLTGPVGCGKSSLLMAIVQELPLSHGSISCSGKTAHVSQIAWIFSGTVQENILFGNTMEPQRYKKVLESCALIRDIADFPNGDMTIIGERGVLLSGGQRARVDLARAVYADADVYLLDDPLSAVDAKVGKHIFEKCICGILENKTRIVVTHCQQFLANAEHIVIMEAGSIISQGSYTELGNITIVHQEMSGFVNSEKSHIFQDTQKDNVAEDLIGLQLEEEDRLTGSVTWSVYWQYFRAGLSFLMLVSLIIFFVVSQVFLVLPDWWVMQMSNGASLQWEQSQNLRIYAGLASMAFIFSLLRSLLFYNSALNSSHALHDGMLAAVLKAPVVFFDTNPVGRVLNRFSTDLAFMDELLPETFVDAIQLLLFCISTIVLCTVLNPWVTFVVVPLTAVFVFIAKYYVKTSREIRRLEALNRSPVLSHLASTLDGLTTIRTYNRGQMIVEELYSSQDTHNKTVFLRLGSIRWLAMRLDILCVCFVTAVLFIAIANNSGAGVIALSLVYTLQLALETSQYGVRQCAEVENYMTSVERVMTYSEIVPEPGYKISAQPSENWPQHGSLQMENISLVYYTGGPQVLKNVSLAIKPQQRIGIVGRTGAGKSSLVAALFRMPEPAGSIIIDGIDIQTINIQSSRRALSVITQDPILFTGTLRMNLDPFEESQDSEIWEALEEAGLKAKVTKLPKQLRYEILECGANFSVGERQLLCLARSLLQKSKIIVLDEATANVDYETDRLIQETIRNMFQECTVITIAHRLNTIMDYDNVVVMEKGRVVEFGEPQALLRKEGGMFYELYRCHEVHI